MPHSYKVEFDRALSGLYDLRVAGIRRLIVKQKGPCPKFTRNFLEEQIKVLQNYATKVLMNGGVEKALDEVTTFERWNSVTHGERDKALLSWAKQVAPKSKSVVYSFWTNGQCLYVGRTVNFRQRLKSHLESRNRYKFRKTGNTIKVRGIASEAQLPKAECLAVALYQPCVNDKKPAGRKYARECPLCKVHEPIERELKSIFRSRLRR